jgi:hypothetical protein
MTGKDNQTSSTNSINHPDLTFFRHESKAIGATRLSDIGEERTFYDVIGVDEGQFFEDVINF